MTVPGKGRDAVTDLPCQKKEKGGKKASNFSTRHRAQRLEKKKERNQRDAHRANPVKTRKKEGSIISLQMRTKKCGIATVQRKKKGKGKRKQ